jgi:hypothetical protein
VTNVANSVGDTVKTTVDNAPLEKGTKDGINKTIEKGVDKVQKVASENLKVVDTIVNNPLANITASAAGPKVRDGLEKVQGVVNDLKNNPNVVGKNKFVMEGAQPLSMQQQIFDKGPPVVTMIQAIDQYGNIVAQSGAGMQQMKIPNVFNKEKFGIQTKKKVNEAPPPPAPAAKPAEVKKLPNIKPGIGWMHPQVNAAQTGYPPMQNMMQYQQAMQGQYGQMSPYGMMPMYYQMPQQAQYLQQMQQ